MDGDLDGYANVGDTIHYIFTVKNIGNVTLYNVTITDPIVTVLGGPTDLYVGEVDGTTFKASHVITQADVDAGHFYNIAEACGSDTQSDEACDTGDNDTPLPQNQRLRSLRMGPG